MVSATTGSSPQPPSPPKAVYNADTEISVGRIFSLGKTALRPDASQPASGNTIQMSSLGQLGRWGNQLFQYAYLHAAHLVTGANVAVPDWAGAHIFDLPSPAPLAQLPPAVEDASHKSNSSFGPMMLQHIKSLSGDADPVVAEAGIADCAPTLVGRDVYGWFQLHSSRLAPWKAQLQELFTPRPHIAAPLDAAVARLRERGDTVVALHIRRGDYRNVTATAFGYMAPTKWYLEWLTGLWPTLKRPVLLVCSDEPEAVLQDFAKFNPVVTDDVLPVMPPELQAAGAGFYPDFYLLSRADVVACSNSTFSTFACMLNPNPDAVFVRPHATRALVSFNPWSDWPVLHRGAALVGSVLDSLAVVYRTQGIAGLLVNVLVQVPTFFVRIGVMRVALLARRMGL